MLEVNERLPFVWKTPENPGRIQMERFLSSKSQFDPT